MNTFQSGIVENFDLYAPKLVDKEEYFAAGHRACQGCGEALAIRLMCKALGKDTVIVNATGCMEVVSTMYPTTAWKLPWMHVAFPNAAAVASGVEAGLKVLRRKGKISDRYVKTVGIGGDGGTVDIGLQALSGAMERGHDMLYVCFDNEAYMNTGIQRSGATPRGANTTTSPAGKVLQGKTQWRKPFTKIMAAHDIPYVAQAAPHNYRDLMIKAKKAFAADGPAVLNVLAPCPRGWRYSAEQTLALAKLAADTCVWPLYEVENGKVTVTYKPREKLPITEWLKSQGRFRHLLRPANAQLVEEIQAKVDAEWEELLKAEANS